VNSVIAGCFPVSLMPRITIILLRLLQQFKAVQSTLPKVFMTFGRPLPNQCLVVKKYHSLL